MNLSGLMETFVCAQCKNLLDCKHHPHDVSVQRECIPLGLCISSICVAKSTYFVRFNVHTVARRIVSFCPQNSPRNVA
jgi:hypothetical protein